MRSEDIVSFVLVSILSLTVFVLSCFQFREKGVLLNNAYLYASKKKRETMDKKPHYRQSAIVFLLLGVIFLILAVTFVFPAKWLYWVNALLILSVIIYAIASSVYIERRRK